MPPIFAALWLGAVALSTGSAIDRNLARFDAPVPQRCATFDARYSAYNRSFCDAWRVEHRIVPPQRTNRKIHLLPRI